jgi:glycosyltransferase involved in cell wall biosynthesis
MHLVVLENEPTSQRGGQELSLLEVCRSLHQRGHQISLFYVKPADLLTQYQSFCRHTIAIKGYKLNQNQGLDTAKSFYQVARTISRFENSLVYTNNYQDSLFGSAIAAVNQLPFICHIRLPFPKTLGIQAKLGLSGATRLITISHQTRDAWKNAGFAAKPFDVIYNGIDLERFSPAIDLAAAKQAMQLAPDARTICYVGRLDKVKGLETLFHAFAQLASQQPNLHLLIAGKPLIQQSAYQITLENLAAQLGIAAQVKFLGHVSDPAIVYQASDLAVLPSTWAEPFGRTLLESMACGVPIVASRVGGIPEVLTGEFAAGLVPAGSAADLAEALRSLVNWRDRDPGLGQRGRQYVADRFSLERAVDRIEQVMLETLSDRRRLNAVAQS